MHEFVRQEATRQSDSSLDSRTSARNPPRRRRDLRRDAYPFILVSNGRRPIRVSVEFLVFLTSADRTFFVRRMNF